MRRTLLLAAILPLVAGCIYSRELSHLSRDVERALDVRLKREFVFTIGPTTFHGLGWIARRVPDPWVQMAGDMAGEIDRVKVGVYRADREPPSARLLPSDLPRLAGSGWEVVVRTSTADESVWVLMLERYGAVRDLIVVSLSGDELVLVRMEGRLDAIVERALADEAFARALGRPGSWDG